MIRCLGVEMFTVLDNQWRCQNPELFLCYGYILSTVVVRWMLAQLLHWYWFYQMRRASSWHIRWFALALQEGFAPPEELEAGAAASAPAAGAVPAPADGLLPAQEEYWAAALRSSLASSLLFSNSTLLTACRCLLLVMITICAWCCSAMLSHRYIHPNKILLVKVSFFAYLLIFFSFANL